MSVSAAVDVDGVLTVTVRDEGTWRPPDRDPGDRGRGLLIMRQLVDTVTLDEQDRGTTVTLSIRLRRTPDVDPDHPVSTSGAAVRVDRDGLRPVVSVTGAVDEVGAEQMRIRLLEASHGGTGRVELDLAGVTLFSSAAVRVVLAIARIARDEGWRLRRPRPGRRRHPAHPPRSAAWAGWSSCADPDGGRPAVWGTARCTSSGGETSAQRRERPRLPASPGRAGVRLHRRRRRA